MKPTSLREFMPYGAPDLIDSRPRHLSRAMMLASALSVATLGAGMGLLRWIDLAPPPPPQAFVDPKDHDVLPEPYTPPQDALPPVEPIPSQPHDDGLIIPVIDAPPLLPEPSTTTPGEVGPVVRPGTTPTTTSWESTGEVRPAIDAFVYVEQLPAAVKEVTPIYPRIALEARVEGKVMVRVLVGRDGRVLDARVVEKFSVPMLDEAALTAARQWIFTPGLANDHPVLCWVSIPFNFTLR